MPLLIVHRAVIVEGQATLQMLGVDTALVVVNVCIPKLYIKILAGFFLIIGLLLHLNNRCQQPPTASLGWEG